jgi:Carboxypeptidase regulatory-like domain/TonB-dependent Receptor Plug Domain
MRLAFTAWIALVAVPAGALAGRQEPPATAAPCRVTGTVVDGQTRAGVSGAAVIFRGPAAARPAPDQSARHCVSGCDAVADSDGRFVIEGLAPGEYAVSASVTGFSESMPLPITLARVGPACEATVEIPYSLQMRAESKAELPRAPEATVIGSPIAPALTGEAIATTPGALEDMFRAMQAQPGVAASQDNRNDLLVRGGGAIENQTRIDGFDVPNPNHFGAQGGTGGALSILPPWLIERGSLELGGFSVAYGDRISSVADVSLRPGRTDRLHAMFGGGVGGAMAIGEGRIGASGSWLASARRSLLEVAFRDETAEAVPTYADALLKIDHRAGERHAFTFLGLGAKDNVSVVDERTGAEETSGEEVVALAGVRFDSAWSARTSSTVAASIGSSEVDVTAMDGTVVDAIDKGHDQELRVRADVRRTHTLVGDVLVGAAVKAYRYDYDLYVNDLWTPYETVKRDLEAHDRRLFTDVAGYAEVAHALPARGRLLVGIRLDHWSAASTTAASPRVKAEFVPARVLRLVGYWGIYRQGVPYIWQASAPGNAGLAPLVSRQFGGGFDVEPTRWLRIGVEAFDKRYDSYPVDPAIPSRVLVSSSADFDSPFVGPLVSEGQVHAYGVDTVAALFTGSRVQVTANYSYWHVLQSGLDEVWRPAEHELRHQGRVELMYRPADGWSTGFRWRYTSGRPYTPYDVKASIKAGRGVYDLNQINTLNYPDYRRIDVRLDKTFIAGPTRIVLYGEVDNLLDHDNVLVYNWNRTLRGPKAVYQWGRTFIAGVRVEF